MGEIQTDDSPPEGAWLIRTERVYRVEAPSESAARQAHIDGAATLERERIAEVRFQPAEGEATGGESGDVGLAALQSLSEGLRRIGWEMPMPHLDALCDSFEHGIFSEPLLEMVLGEVLLERAAGGGS